MTQKERQARSRREILQAAQEEFGSSGYDGVNMEGICTRHGISKGMMYHYYSNKDELFLLCVQDTFQELKDYVEREPEALSGQSGLAALRNYFLCREHFFQQHPGQKRIFETAMLHPPAHLEEQIQALRAPIRALNQRFLERVIAGMDLRPGLGQKQAARYLESAESVFWSVVRQYQVEQEEDGLHTVLGAVQEVLDMVLFGVVRQQEQECPR